MAKKKEIKMTASEAAEYLGVSAMTLAIWRHKKTGPSYYKYARDIEYRKSDLDSFIESRRVDLEGSR